MIRPASRFRLFLRQLCAIVPTMLMAATACRAQSAPATAANWEQTGWGGGGYFYCAAYHPTKKDVIYMAGDVAGVYKSVDNGRNWRMINNGIARYPLFSLSVDHP